jgi:two-component system chemotaxis sensor kinase CheA
MSAVSDDITADFIIEAQEILDRLGEQLVSLEQAPQDTDQLNAVFRGYHTLKGGAGFLGVTAMVELCHAAEEALGARVPARPCCRPITSTPPSNRWTTCSRCSMRSAGTEPGDAPPDLIAQFDVHGGAAAPAAPQPPHRAGGGDLITEDEFEALLDQLHGGNAPTAVAGQEGRRRPDQRGRVRSPARPAARWRRTGAKPAPPAPAPPPPRARHRTGPPPAAKPLAEPNTPCAWTPSAWMRSST